MAVTNKNSEQFVLELYKGEHDVESDTLKCALLGTGFGTYNPATHATYSDVSANEVANGNGYTTGGAALTTVAAAIVSNEAMITCDNPSWTASAGAIGDTKAAVVYNDTHASKTIICCIEYGATYSTTVGTSFEIDFSNGLTKGVPNPA